MRRETMTPIERTTAAMRLESTDRVPLVPHLSPEAAAHLVGVTMAQVSNDAQIAQAAFLKVFDEYGGWDSAYGGPITPVQMQAANIYPMKTRIPGRDLPDDYMFQLVEEEVMKPEDYDKMYEMGPEEFYYEDYLWRIADFPREQLPRLVEEMLLNWSPWKAELDKRGVEPFVMANSFHPFFKLSVMRSMVPFTKDLYYNPEPVERALKQMTSDLIPRQIGLCKAFGVNSWLLVDERGSGFNYPLSVFERFWWPYTQEIIDAFWAEGITTVFHLDTCWDKNLPYFRQLPKGSTVIELDSTTDIFRAKEILRGHLCIHGDVSASLLSLGTPEEVAAYCRKLIDVVGAGGGFILGTGCAAPPDCKAENFRAMVETGRGYELSRI
jgi:hypothetical protein